MSDHSHYESLAVLAAGGHLSEEELCDLHKHEESCEACKNARIEFQKLVQLGLPLAQSNLRRNIDMITSRPYPGARERFIRRASLAGIRFSEDVLKQAPSRRPYLGFAAASAGVVAAILLAFFCGSYRAGGTFLRPGQQNSAQAQRQLDHLTQENASLAAKISAQENALAAQRQESPGLRANKVVAPGAAADNSGNAERQQANATQPTPQSAPLLEEAVAKQKILEEQLADARSELVRLNKAHESDQTSMVGNQLRISQLSDQLKTAKQNATNMQKQLAAIGGDDRNVMGSRRLHVIDIRDTDQDGQPGKAFGRIFLTEGKSLVFYAFDLGDPARTDAQRAFQVWGQQEGKASSLRSLGFLNVDDKTQRRWALKSDDSASFDKINSIFVTVERRGGAKTPSGQHLLFAYLGEPNHP